MSTDLDYEEVKVIVGALPGYWRREADHSGNVFTISRDGAREVKTIWIDGAKVVHEVSREELKKGRLMSVDGRNLDVR